RATGLVAGSLARVRGASGSARARALRRATDVPPGRPEEPRFDGRSDTERASAAHASVRAAGDALREPPARRQDLPGVQARGPPRSAPQAPPDATPQAGQSPQSRTNR